MTTSVRDYSALSARLDKLETQNRLMKQGGALAVVLAAIVVLTAANAQPGPKVSEVVEAKKFVLRDKDGKMRAVLSASDNTTSLTLYDETEYNRAELIVGKGKTEMTLAVRKPEAPRLRLVASEDIVEVELNMTPLELKARKATLSAGKGGLGLTMGDGTGRAAFLNVLEPSTSLQLFGEKGRSLLQVFNKQPEISLYDEKGNKVFTKP